MSTLVILGIIAAIALYAISIYNRLVKNRQMTEEGWSGIDVQLKRRADLIPNLVNAVKGYMKHEKELLENVTKLRANAVAAEGSDPETRAKAESALSGGLMKLNAVIENYPDLKANQNVLELQNSLSETEDEIQMSRRYYNGAARNLNILVESFPSNLIANYFKFIKAQYFEIEEATDRNVPTVEL
ncbi:MAG: LemA family protein [Fimbriimonadaceae bacterium]|nr:LemA family protein [Alphaproteobacteria bacterium]